MNRYIKSNYLLLMFRLVAPFCSIIGQSNTNLNKVDLSEWELVWNDEFDYEDKQLDEKWISANHPSKNLYCSRWRENAVVKNGVLELQNRKEKRGGQDWTSGSVWTKKKFKYGYFECRYKYAGAKATNNSFWLMTRGKDPIEGKKFEIDINEGHYPNEVNTNIHKWSDFTYDKNGKKIHESFSKSFPFGTQPGYTIQLEIPVQTTKIRFSSQNHLKFNMGEFRVFGVKEGSYPEVLSNFNEGDFPGLINYANDNNVSITSSNNKSSESKLTDDNYKTSWASQEKGEKWIEFEWQEEKTVGCIQFVNGWQDKNGNWRSLINDYKVQYFNNGKWSDISVLNVKDQYNFAEKFYTFGLEWDEKEIIFYFEGKEIRRENNTFCYSETPIWLSLAIVKWAGPLTNAVDGTSMKVDYVRYYNKKKKLEN